MTENKDLKVPIKELNCYSHGVTITAVLKRLTPVHERKTCSLFYFTLLDNSGSIQCVCFDSRIHNKIANNITYEVSNFHVERNKLDNKLQIVVKSETKFLTVETLEIPEVSFVSIRNIIDVKQANDLIDFKGKFIDVPVVKKLKLKNGEESRKLIARLTDGTNLNIVLNAWNDLIDGLMNHLPDTNFRFYNVSVKEYNQTKFLEFTVLSSMEPDEMSSQLS
ncbi:uncharacterized protein [Bemisia tabaci]|uniref:uncharacterized protein isoform X1 n=1 Tax=Bemisia tabaci TaxID=7038 RepID=UPI003B28D668